MIDKAQGKLCQVTRALPDYEETVKNINRAFEKLQQQVQCFMYPHNSWLSQTLILNFKFKFHWLNLVHFQGHVALPRDHLPALPNQIKFFVRLCMPLHEHYVHQRAKKLEMQVVNREITITMYNVHVTVLLHWLHEHTAWGPFSVHSHTTCGHVNCIVESTVLLSIKDWRRPVFMTPHSTVQL